VKEIHRIGEATLLLSCIKKDKVPISCHRQGRWSLTAAYSDQQKAISSSVLISAS